MEFSDLHKKIINEGFEPLAIYHNTSFASQTEEHTTPPLKRIIEERHLAFRIIPAYLAYEPPEKDFSDCHMIYVRKGVDSKFDLLKGCELNTDI